MIYNYQKEKFTELINTLESLPKEYQKPKYSKFIIQTTLISALTKQAEAIL